jgi:hypothetical protein
MRDVKKFVENLLSYASLSQKWTEIYTTPENLAKFDRALTHISYDVANNYERYEFMGDALLNFCVMRWLDETYPDIINIGWLQKCRSLLQSTNFIAPFARSLGVESVVLYDPGYVNRYHPGSNVETKAYLSMLEDCVEATFAVITSVMEENGSEDVVGMKICKDITYGYLNTTRPNMKDYRFVYEPSFILKQIYDTMRWPWGWIEVRNQTPGKIRVSLRGWPTYDIRDANIVVREDMKRLFERYKLPLQGRNTKEIVEIVENMVKSYQSAKGGNMPLTRLVYSTSYRDPTPNIPLNIRNDIPFLQFTTYFGKGEELGALEMDMHMELKDIKQLVAKNILDSGKMSFITTAYQPRWDDPPRLKPKYEDMEEENE